MHRICEINHRGTVNEFFANAAHIISSLLASSPVWIFKRWTSHVSKWQRISNRMLAHKLWIIIKRWWQLEYTPQVLWSPESKKIRFLLRTHSQKLAYITFKSELKVYPRRNPFFIHTKNHKQRLLVVIKIVQTVIFNIHPSLYFQISQASNKMMFTQHHPKQNLNPKFFKFWVRILSIFLCVTIVVYRGYDSWQTTERTHFSLSFWVTNKVPRYSVTILFCGMSILHCIKRIWITSVQTEDLLFFNYLNKQQN